MNWIDARKELPDDGLIVAVLRYHWKECWPLSAEIIFGEVESYINERGFRICRANTSDFTGGGSYCWYFPIDGLGDSNSIACWTRASEFKKPDFLRHNPHWGGVHA